MKGYLRIELDRPSGKYFAGWFYDAEDPDEATIVLDMKKVYVITDVDGNPVLNKNSNEPEISTTYDDIGIDKPGIRSNVRAALASKKPLAFFRERHDSTGVRYLIRSGIVYAEGHGPPFYVAIGLPVQQNQ